jgi:chromate reductase, NAD(P)H dehydrogenase (quinone)
MRILAISGSLREGSLNTRLLREMAEQAPAGVEIEIWNGLRSIPPYDADEDDEPGPESVDALRQAIAEADGLLFATPEYNASIPGVLKNAIDWVSGPPLALTPLTGKPAAVVGATTGRFGAVWAQAELRKVLATTGARVVDLELPIAKADGLLDQHGRLIVHDHIHDRTGEILRALFHEIERNQQHSLAA